MKEYFESIQEIFGDNYFTFFENEKVESSGPWMVSDIVFGFTYIRLLDSALRYSKEAVLKEYEKNKSSTNLNDILTNNAVFPSGETLGFYNTSRHDLDKISNELDYNESIRQYIDGFSENVKEALSELNFNEVLDFLYKTQMTLPVLRTFTEANINPDNFSSHDKFMKIFQEFIKNIWHDEICSIGRDPISNYNPMTSYHYVHQTVAEYGSFMITLLLSGRDFENDEAIKIYDPDSSGTYRCKRAD